MKYELNNISPETISDLWQSIYKMNQDNCNSQKGRDRTVILILIAILGFAFFNSTKIATQKTEIEYLKEYSVNKISYAVAFDALYYHLTHECKVIDSIRKVSLII